MSIKKYKNSYKKYGNSPKAMAWKDKKAQDLRFEILLKDMDFKGKTILDFGCGMGDIIPKILVNTNDIEYKGVDNVSEFIDIARHTYKTRTVNEQKYKTSFSVRDILKKQLRKKYDIVICSGALNSNSDDAVSFRQNAIKILWGHAREMFAFNMSGFYPQPGNKASNRVYYADSMEILKYCLTLTSKVIFRQNYHRRDFTITMFR